MYVVKIEFDNDTSIKTGIQFFCEEKLIKAARIFNTMSYAYALAQPFPAKDKSGKVQKVDILGVWIYEAVSLTSEGAIAEVKAGNATLIDNAPEIAFDLEEPN